MILCIDTFPFPHSGKWTQTPNAILRLFLGSLGGLFASLVVLALGPLKYEIKVGQYDDTFSEWNRIASNASKVYLAFLTDRSEQVKVAIFLIADEAFRYLTYTFMYLAANAGEYNPRHPSPIQILASACRSPVYTCLCHLASLLSGTSSRLILVWRLRGVASFEELFQQYPRTWTSFSSRWAMPSVPFRDESGMNYNEYSTRYCA